MIYFTRAATRERTRYFEWWQRSSLEMLGNTAVANNLNASPLGRDITDRLRSGIENAYLANIVSHRWVVAPKIYRNSGRTPVAPLTRFEAWSGVAIDRSIVDDEFHTALIRQRMTEEAERLGVPPTVDREASRISRKLVQGIANRTVALTSRQVAITISEHHATGSLSVLDNKHFIARGKPFVLARMGVQPKMSRGLSPEQRHLWGTAIRLHEEVHVTDFRDRAFIASDGKDEQLDIIRTELRSNCAEQASLAAIDSQCAQTSVSYLVETTRQKYNPVDPFEPEHVGILRDLAAAGINLAGS